MFETKNKIARFVLSFLFSLILIFNLFNLSKSYQDIYNQHKNVKLINVIQAYTNLIHELQKERSKAYTYIYSEGEMFREELIEQINSTDNSLFLYKKITNKNEYIIKDLSQLNKKIENLSVLRNKTLEIRIEKKKLLKEYKNLVNYLLERINYKIGKISGNKEKDYLESYYSLLSAKELMVIEKTLVSCSLIKDDWESNKFKMLLENSKSQIYYIENFKKKAPEYYSERYNSLEEKKSFKEIVKIKEKIFFKTGDFEIDPKYWFKISTSKINGLHKINKSLLINLEIENINKLENNIKKILEEIGYLLFYILIYLCILVWLKKPNEIIEEAIKKEVK